MESTESLEFELAILVENQNQALQQSPYLRMERAMQAAYNQRRERIKRLRELLSSQSKSGLRLRTQLAH